MVMLLCEMENFSVERWVEEDVSWKWMVANFCEEDEKEEEN